MKKISLLLVLAVLLSGGIAFAYDEGTVSHKKEQSGAGLDTPVRVYALYRYAERGANAVSLSQGEVVVLDSISDDGVTVGKQGTAGSTDAVVGVVVSSSIPTADSTGTAAQSVGLRNWGWVQIYGLCDSAMVKATAAAGQALAADGASGSVYATPVTDANEDGLFAFAMDAVSSNAEDVQIFIKNR